MKKHLIFVLALSCAGFGLTACHDDDDDDNSTQPDKVCDFTSGVTAYSSLIGNLTSKMGVNTYALSDASKSCDVYTFATSDAIVQSLVNGTSESLTSEDFLSGSNDWYGGFIPTWFDADDEDCVFTPIDSTFHTGSGALLCNPGIACRAILSKHYQTDFATATNFLTLGDIKGFWVNTTYLYSLLEGDTETMAEYDIAPLEPGQKIQLKVYGYVDSFNLSNLQKAFETLKNAASNVAGGGTVSKSVIDLASCDANGKVSVLKDWTYVDLSDIDDYYMFEVYISTEGFDDGATLSDYLNIVLIDDITFESKSLF